MTGQRPHDDRIRSILVPTDFSHNAEVAMRWAMQIARTHEASITLLHVADVVSLTSLPLQLQEQITQSLQRLRSEVQAAGVEVSIIQRAGRPWERTAAEAAEAQLVVIGARGQTPHAVHVLGLGSTTDRVLRASPVPVLTVHTGDAVGDRLPRRIVLPTESSEAAAATLAALVRLLRPTAREPFDVTLLYAWQPLLEYEYAFAGTAVLNPVDGTEEQARDMVEAIAAELRSDAVQVTPVVRAGHPARVIEEEIGSIGAELVGLSTHGRSGLPRLMLGSVAERVVHRAPCPVLTVRQPAIGEGEPAVIGSARAAG